MSARDQSLALIRIELKLDMILASLAGRDPVLHSLLTEGSGLLHYSGDTCPACQAKVQLGIDLATETYTRTCGCAPPVSIVPGISGLNTRVPDKKTTNPEEPEETADAES